jgi:hypothetical protein
LYPADNRLGEQSESADAGDISADKLALDQAPPFSVVLRFFFVAPFFGVAAGALIAINGSTLLIDRFQPLSYALTHTVAIGLICSVMIGALFFMLPVAAGVKLPAVKPFSLFVALALAAGALALCVGFVQNEPIGFALGGFLLLASLLAFAAVAVHGLYRAESTNSSLWLIRLALIGLFITASLGAHLSLVRYTQNSAPLSAKLSDLHIGWGFAIWISLTIMGGARQVLPMFYATSAYPKICCQIGVPLLYFAMIAMSFFAVLPIEWLDIAPFVKICAVTVLVMFAVITFAKIYKLDRFSDDLTLSYWLFSMCSLIAAAPLIFISDARAIAAFAVLFIGGFALSLINATIYKLVPALALFYLNAAVETPTANDFISAKAMRLQTISHIAAIAFLTAGALYDPLARIGGGLFAASWALIFKDMLVAVLRYSAEKKKRR